MWVWVLLLLGPVLGLQDELLLPLSAPVESSSTISVSDIDGYNSCFAVLPSACPQFGETCRCRRIDKESAVCCHITSPFHLNEGLGCIAVKNFSLNRLHIWNATLPDLDNLSKRNLESVAISQSRLERLGLAGNVSCLNISGNSIAHLPTNTFLPLPNLQFLSIASLNLTKLPKFKVNLTLDLSGNGPFECSVVLQYLKENPHLRFVKETETFCSSPKIFHWFNSTELVPLAQMQNLRNIEADCIPGCECRPRSMDMVFGSLPRFSVLVDCSSKGLQELPEHLPPNTIVLNVSYNNITSLKPLSDEKSYENVRELYADSNHISSILELEGSTFIDSFVVLSLRENHIKSLPIYILANIFDRNQHRTVKLGFNRFSCNCSAAQILKLWLLGNKKHVLDYDQIYCDNMAEKVIELDPNKVCVYERDWTDYIYYIIAGEVGLLFLLVSKVSYDYWVFKTAGYLPWPASKMPKLPCDWVFE